MCNPIMIFFRIPIESQQLFASFFVIPPESQRIFCNPNRILIPFLIILVIYAVLDTPPPFQTYKDKHSRKRISLLFLEQNLNWEIIYLEELIISFKLWTAARFTNASPEFRRTSTGIGRGGGGVGSDVKESKFLEMESIWKQLPSIKPLHTSTLKATKPDLD